MQDNLKILSNEKICPKLFRLKIAAGSSFKKSQPGQFIHIRVRDGLEPFFRRPFSLAGVKKGAVEIIYDVVGLGTKILSEKKKGETLDVLGPLGTGFRLPPHGIKNVVLVGGGVGVAPLLMLADALKGKKCQMTLLYGARTKDYIFSFKDFRSSGGKCYISTDDGSKGVKGRVSSLFSVLKGEPQETFIYTCGPKPMMTVVRQFAAEKGINGQASYEEVMACGTGTCLGCAMETTQGYKTVCHDGPVFDFDIIK